jgi:hypothetical protein
VAGLIAGVIRFLHQHSLLGLPNRWPPGVGHSRDWQQKRPLTPVVGVGKVVGGEDTADGEAHGGR